MSDDGAGRPRSGVGRWLAWMAIVVVAVVIVAASVVSGRAWVAIAAVVGLLLAWLLSLALPFARRRPWIAVGVLCGGLGIAALVLLLASTRDSDPLPGAIPGAPPGSVTVRYHAEGQVDGESVALREELVVDETALAAAARTLGAGNVETEQIALEGWLPASPVDGFATFERNRTVTSGESSVVVSTVTIPLDLGYLSVQTEGKESLVRLYPRDGSEVEIAASKGAVGTMYPAPAATTDGLRPGREEVATINVDRNVDEISLALLAGALRNPAGKTIYEAVLWGPLPWAVGAIFLLVASLVGDKVKQLLGWAAGRAIGTRRGARGNAATETATDPAARGAPGNVATETAAETAAEAATKAPATEAGPQRRG